MATYPAITPGPDTWTVIPAAAVDRTGQVLFFGLWISDDAAPTLANAQLIDVGQRFFIAANKVYRVWPANPTGGAQLRLMDY